MHLNKGCFACGGCGCASVRNCGLLENLMEVHLCKQVSVGTAVRVVACRRGQ